MTRPRFAAAVLVVLLAGTLAGCATNPVTGKRELVLVSEAQEIQMGQQGAADVAQTVGVLPDTGLEAYVQRLGVDLAHASQRPALPWQFRVVDDPTPNAFALPGGYIFVTRGLLGIMTTEAELATVVGHEIGHVAARHQVRALTRAQLAQLGLAVGSIVSPVVARYGQLAGTGLQLLFLKYDRAAEAQADQLGFDYALARHYDVAEMADVFTTLDRLTARSGQSPLPGWLETHPSGPDRIAAIQARIAALPPAARGTLVRRDEYLRRVDGLVYGVDPRNGYFDGARFLHPTLRFQLDFPAGWTTQNLPSAVVGASPAQDAALELTLADSGSAAGAIGAFATAEGVQVTGRGSRTLHGIPALVADFTAQSQQGAVVGQAVFLDYGGHTFRLLAYTTGTGAAASRAALDQAVASFAPLTDPRALGAQPHRIRLVRVDRATTLADFNARYPSVVPIDELAILNQLQGASSQIPAGTVVKRVVAGS